MCNFLFPIVLLFACLEAILICTFFSGDLYKYNINKIIFKDWYLRIPIFWAHVN